MASVTFDKATRNYRDALHPAVNSLSLHVADGELLVMLGPSGSGKSTTLRMLAGLEALDSGRILLDDTDITTLAPQERDIAVVFQNYALYPHMTIAENMGFALKIAGMDDAEIDARVHEAARILDLEPYLERTPKALSGGQRHRVAMGRAIVREPRVFLMDEPLANLDPRLREQTRAQIVSLQRRLAITTIYATQDIGEAFAVADRIAIVNKGVLEQVGTPQELRESPANDVVADYLAQA